MNHLAKAQLAKGNNELIIEDISNAIDANSIQVNCNDNVTVMGVEFSTDYLKDEIKTPAIRALEVELLESNGAAINEETDVLNWKLSLAADEVKKVRISYSVKYPKDKLLNLN